MEILDTIPVYESNAPIAFISFFVMIISVGLLTYGANRYWHEVIISLFGVLAFIGFVFLFITSTKIAFKQYDHNEYVLRIEDDYPISKLYEKYEVVSKDKYSNVYTVKDIKYE